MNNIVKDPMILANQSVTVVGTVRNCENSITKEYRRLQDALVAFETVNFFVVESDSTDGSVVQLEKLRSSYENFDFVSLGNLKSKLPLRTERIAHCRNRYLEELKMESKYASTEYVLVSDLDGMNELLTKEGISSCWSFEGWDVCTANQEGKYYDIWALRHPEWSPKDCWEEFLYYTNELKMLGPIAERKAIGSKQIHIPTSRKPIEVESAFGGLGIYKRKAIENAQYKGLTDDGKEICEHLYFHQQIRRNGFKIFINPKLINCRTPREHIHGSLKEQIKYSTAKYFPAIYRLLKKTR